MKRRNLLLLLGGATTAVAVATVPSWGEDAPPPEAKGPKLRTATAELDEFLPPLAPLREAQWLTDSDLDGPRSIPGPDFEMVGFLRTRPGLFAELKGRFAFEPAPKPNLDDYIAKHLAPVAPAGATWVRSKDFDSSLGVRMYVTFDAGSDLVYFRAINPKQPQPSGTPQPGASASG
ncbi:hypothetical protein ACGFX4_24950 [Kitasatospora sp. NPDC048365]|uniref:hypothetical protein n=1 Tax=Kitasatospora sp. NPDC048365 TaxID=3364050 RepID=UPI0037223D5C